MYIYIYRSTSLSIYVSIYLLYVHLPIYSPTYLCSDLSTRFLTTCIPYHCPF